MYVHQEDLGAMLPQKGIHDMCYEPAVLKMASNPYGEHPMINFKINLPLSKPAAPCSAAGSLFGPSTLTFLARFSSWVSSLLLAHVLGLFRRRHDYCINEELAKH